MYVNFFKKRKLNALQKIFPNGVIGFDHIEKIEKDWTTKIITKQEVYSVTLPFGSPMIITPEQTKQIEKKRLRITSLDSGNYKILLQRKLKVFDWFLIYFAMRLSFGVLTVYGFVVWLG